MIRLKILFLLVLFSQSCFGQNEAEQIFIKATDRLLTSNMKMSLNQKTADKKGNIKEKSFDIMIAKFGEEEKTKMVIQKPERAAGITIVMSRLPDEKGIIEVYTPANGKTRKMIATKKNMATVGSDFSFSNYSSTNWEDLNIKLLEMEEVDGRNCYKLEVNAKENTDGGKAELFVEQDTYSIVKIVTFKKNGTKQSISKLSDFQSAGENNNKFQPGLIQTQNLDKNEFTEIRIEKIAPLNDANPEDFTIKSEQK